MNIRTLESLTKEELIELIRHERRAESMKEDSDALTAAYMSGYYDGKKAVTSALEPVAYLYRNGEHQGVRLHKCTEMSLPTNTVQQGLITANQAKAYADAMVREALEEAAEIAGQYNAFSTSDAIHALIPQEDI